MKTTTKKPEAYLVTANGMRVDISPLMDALSKHAELREIMGGPEFMDSPDEEKLLSETLIKMERQEEIFDKYCDIWTNVKQLRAKDIAPRPQAA